MQDATTPLDAAAPKQEAQKQETPQKGSPLSHYLRHLNILENTEEPSVEETVEVMLARDAVEQWMNPQVETKAVSKVVHLDNRLRSQAEKMTHLSTCRDTVKPPADSWWWWLSTITIDTAEMISDNAEDQAEAEAAGVPKWARWDWLWNLGTVSCLVVSTGLMSQTAKAFSEEGFDLLGTISTIGQGAGLAIVASGAVTDDGKKKVQAVLKGAIATYETDANLGKPEFNNALARALLVQGFQAKNWNPPLRKQTLSQISLRLDRADRALPVNVS
ncbi:MAG: hypothetical protein AAFQ63_08440 [Cyanobacteria bacterium J06621_11]